MKRAYGGTLEEKLERGIVRIPFSGCHIWILSSAGKGYGVISHDGIQKYLHRLMWEMHNGEIPDGMLICHTCDTPACANPNHLFLGTPKDNSMDREKKGRRRGGFPEGYVHPMSIDPSLGQGENNPTSKITSHDAMTIVGMYESGIPLREIASTFGLDRNYTWKIANRRVWKHLWLTNSQRSQA